MVKSVKIKYTNKNQKVWNKSKMYVVRGLLENEINSQALAIPTMFNYHINQNFGSDIVIQHNLEFTFKFTIIHDLVVSILLITNLFLYTFDL